MSRNSKSPRPKARSASSRAAPPCSRNMRRPPCRPLRPPPLRPPSRNSPPPHWLPPPPPPPRPPPPPPPGRAGGGPPPPPAGGGAARRPYRQVAHGGHVLPIVEPRRQGLCRSGQPGQGGRDHLH